MYILNFADDVLSILDVLENISYDDFTNLAFKTGKLAKQGAKVAYKLSLDTVWVLSYVGAICYLLGRELASKKPLTQVCTAELEAPQGSLEIPKAVKNVTKKSPKRGSPVHQEQTALDNPTGSRRGGRVAKKQG